MVEKKYCTVPGAVDSQFVTNSNSPALANRAVKCDTFKSTRFHGGVHGLPEEAAEALGNLLCAADESIKRKKRG